MAFTTTTDTAADALARIISAGVTAYQNSLPDYAREPIADVETQPIIALTDERQRELCFSCALNDCVGVESAACPIRIEQRRIWREQRRR